IGIIYVISMEIKSVKLNNYRNYTEEKVYFSPKLNVLLGKNAQGKTNLLEAIYFCSIAKSPRTKKETDLIKWEKDGANILLEFNTKAGEKKIEIAFKKKGKKIVKLNKINILKIADLIGAIKCVYFSPDELKLVKDAPQDRRKFLDTDISQLDKNYFYSLLKYNKILDSRNKLLKEEKDSTALKETLKIWSTQLAKVGAKIILKRIKFLDELKEFARRSHAYLTNGEEDLVLSYQGIIGENEEEIEKKLLDEYKKTEEKDIKLGFTNIGPHRDDIEMLVNNVDIRTFGSQGQHRTVALSLKLAELEIFKIESGEYPVLLLDDVLSELDKDRQSKLLDITNKIQTIMTTTNVNEYLLDKATIIRVDEGKIIR
ncbi:MAG: DNA replication/repair protein RecF, partial [Clostridiales bacterium]|nr:DNA replication/repair protein RecF [Candidatus Apopatousia equi]